MTSPPIFLKRVNREIRLFEMRKDKEKFFPDNTEKFLEKIDTKIDYNLDNCNNLSNLSNLSNYKNYKLLLYYRERLLLQLDIIEHYPFKPYSIDYCDLMNTFYRDKVIFNHTLEKRGYIKFLADISRYINNKKYNTNIIKFFYKIFSNNNSRLIKGTGPNYCICCNSIMCNDKWCPSKTFHDYLMEYFEVKFIIQFVAPLNYRRLSLVYDELFNHGNLFGKLPEEIILMILNYFVE